MRHREDHLLGVARLAQLAVDFQLVLLELLFNAGFLIVISSTLDTLLGGGAVAWVAAMFVPIAALSCTRWLRDLWPLSAIGLGVYLIGVMGLTYWRGAVAFHHHIFPMWS